MDIDFIRGCIEDVIEYENLNIQLPADEKWTRLDYNVGPLEANITLYDNFINLQIFIGEYDRNVIGPELVPLMAASISGPGLSIKSEMKPRSKFHLNLDVDYADDIDAPVVTDMIMQTAWMSINLLKHGVDSGSLLNPDSNLLAQHGLIKPFANLESDSRNRHWFNNDAGIDFLKSPTNGHSPSFQDYVVNNVFDPRFISFMSIFHNGKEVVGLGTSSDHEDGIQYRVDGTWHIVPENIAYLDVVEELLIAPEFYVTVLDLFDQGSDQLINRVLRGEFSSLPDL
jgi:hypothetical protein